MKANGMGKKGRRAKKIWIPLMVVVLIAAGLAGYYYWTQQNVSTAEAAATSTFNTSQVRQGSITISASGSGKLVAAQEKNLAFSTVQCMLVML